MAGPSCSPDGPAATGAPAAAAPWSDYELQVGQNAASEMERQYGLYTDAAANARVARLANVVLRASGCQAPVRIRLLDSGEPNGLALPGGYIFLTRGLVKLLPEDELLTAALAHEIAHIALGHMSQMLQERAASRGAEGHAVGDGRAPGLGEPGTSSQARQPVPQNPMHAREKEADRAAARYLCMANVAPRILVRLLGRLSEQPELDASASTTHPTWEDRIRSVTAYMNTPEFQAQMSSWAPFRSDRQRPQRRP